MHLIVIDDYEKCSGDPCSRHVPGKRMHLIVTDDYEGMISSLPNLLHVCKQCQAIIHTWE